MCDGSRKDQEKCTDDPLLLEFKNVSCSWAFFYFLRLLNTIFTMQIICSALVHWVKTLSVFNLSGTFLCSCSFWISFSKTFVFIVFFEVAHICNALHACVASQCPVSHFVHNCFYETNWEKKCSHFNDFALSLHCVTQ